MAEFDLKNKCESGTLISVAEMKSALCDKEETSLKKRYSDYDSWRRPQNIGESMMGVGYAAELLNNYRNKVETMNEDEVVKLYRSAFGK